MKIKPGIYEHYKGKRYLVIGTALHTETDDFLVIYEPLYPCEQLIFARPLAMFLDTVIVEGKEVPRFKKLKKNYKEY